MIIIPDFPDVEKKIQWLVANKSLLIAQKKATVKLADSFVYSPFFVLNGKNEDVVKAEDGIVPADATKLKVRMIINTTKLFDSHADVHFDQLWNKSLSETKQHYHVKEHNFGFDGIISDEVKAFAKQMTWHELGLNFEGKTQALVYDSIIDKSETVRPEMFTAYQKGKVKQHSVGMRYVKVDLAVNDNRYSKEFDVWEKWFEEIVNKQDVLDNGYFWAVTEAKNIEGSAVVKGSNWATPTLSIQQTKDEPLKDTHKETEEPPKRTLKASELMNMYQPKNHI
jgi:hypothetical protein